MSRPRVAFVGSGGATKGIAHVGVLKAMEELGLTADVFVGASTGAIAGAFAAQGVRTDEMIDWLRPAWRREQPESALKSRYLFGPPSRDQWASLGWLTSGVFSLDRFERFLAGRLPDNDFRKLSRPLLVTATDVDGRGRVVFGKGHIDEVPISQAVAASSAIPLLFRPYRIGDRYYVDGELVRTLSIDLAVEAGADVVIVSNVYRPHVTKPGEPSLVKGGAPSMFRQAANVMLSEKEKRGIDLIHRLYPHLTILNISPDLGHLSFLDLRNARQLLTRGYREAIRVLAGAKQRGVFEVRAGVRAVGKA